MLYKKNSNCLFINKNNTECTCLKTRTCENCKFFKNKNDKREQKLQREYNIKLQSNMKKSQLIYEIERRANL